MASMGNFGLSWLLFGLVFSFIAIQMSACAGNVFRGFPNGPPPNGRRQAAIIARKRSDDDKKVDRKLGLGFWRKRWVSTVLYISSEEIELWLFEKFNFENESTFFKWTKVSFQRCGFYIKVQLVDKKLELLSERKIWTRFLAT